MEALVVPSGSLIEDRTTTLWSRSVSQDPTSLAQESCHVLWHPDDLDRRRGKGDAKMSNDVEQEYFYLQYGHAVTNLAMLSRYSKSSRDGEGRTHAGSWPSPKS